MLLGPVNLLRRAKQKTRGFRREGYVLYLALRHPATPWYAKLLAVGVVIYAISPIDLIPDPIPILGYLDDIIIVPLGIKAVRWLIPTEVLAECRQRAAAGVAVYAKWKWAGVILIILLWLLFLAWITLTLWRWLSH